MTLDCPELGVAYRGGVRRRGARGAGDGDGADGGDYCGCTRTQGRGSFSDVVFNSLQAGGPVAMQRLRAGLWMPGTINGINERSPWFVGLGADVDGAEVERGLGAADKWERVEAVDEVRRGREVPAGVRASGGVAGGSEAVVRLHAAVAVLAGDENSVERGGCWWRG